MYVTEEYYTDQYAGMELDSAKLKKLIKRAERDIDRLTYQRIRNFETMPESKKTAIRNAVCAQVEFLVENGETASTVSGGGGSFSIGSYSESGGSSAESQAMQYAPVVRDYLYPTGLLYAGAMRYGC